MFEDFTDIEIPLVREIVYILYFTKNDEEIYFYVGESRRILGRLGDYISANFYASTDFKVGEAVKYLSARGFVVRVKYKTDLDRKVKEKEIHNHLKKMGFKLLNDLGHYDYTLADVDKERRKILDFLNEIIH